MAFFVCMRTIIICLLICLTACNPNRKKYEYYVQHHYRLLRIDKKKATFIVPKHPTLGKTVYIEETINLE